MPDETPSLRLTDQIQAAIVDVLTPYGSDAAIVSRETTEGFVTFRIAPANPIAAAIALTITLTSADLDQVLLTFGNTSAIFRQAPGDAPERMGRKIENTLEAIIAGRFVEVGPGHGHAELMLLTGEKVRLGEEKSPIARRFGPKKRYEAYSKAQ